MEDRCKDEWMDIRMDGWMDDICLDEWIDILSDVWMIDVKMNGLIFG